MCHSDAAKDPQRGNPDVALADYLNHLSVLPLRRVNEITHILHNVLCNTIVKNN